MAIENKSLLEGLKKSAARIGLALGVLVGGAAGAEAAKFNPETGTVRITQNGDVTRAMDFVQKEYGLDISVKDIKRANHRKSLHRMPIGTILVIPGAKEAAIAKAEKLKAQEEKLAVAKDAPVVTRSVDADPFVPRRVKTTTIQVDEGAKIQARIDDAFKVVDSLKGDDVLRAALERKAAEIRMRETFKVGDQSQPDPVLKAALDRKAAIMREELAAHTRSIPTIPIMTAKNIPAIFPDARFAGKIEDRLPAFGEPSNVEWLKTLQQTAGLNIGLSSAYIDAAKDVQQPLPFASILGPNKSTGLSWASPLSHPNSVVFKVPDATPTVKEIVPEKVQPKKIVHPTVIAKAQPVLVTGSIKTDDDAKKVKPHNHKHKPVLKAGDLTVEDATSRASIKGAYAKYCKVVDKQSQFLFFKGDTYKALEPISKRYNQACGCDDERIPLLDKKGRPLHDAKGHVLYARGYETGGACHPGGGRDASKPEHNTPTPSKEGCGSCNGGPDAGKTPTGPTHDGPGNSPPGSKNRSGPDSASLLEDVNKQVASRYPGIRLTLA